MSGVVTEERAGEWRRRPAFVVALLTVVSFAGWIVASVLDAAPDPTSAGADTFSPSVIGHRALFELLRASGMSPVRARFRSAETSGDGLLVLAEPEASTESASSEAGRAPRLGSMLRRDGDTLLVLPKRRERGGRIGVLEHEPKTSLLPVDVAESVAHVAASSASVVRVKDAAVDVHGFSFAAPGGTQLVTGASEWRTVLGCDDGALLLTKVGEGHRRWLLADPDLLATHGLARPGGPTAVVRMFRDMLPAESNVVVWDETLHGFEHAPGFWTRFGAPPLVFVLLHAAVAFVLALWAGAVRFGRARDVAVLGAEGKQALVALTADLLTSVKGGTGAAVARHAESLLRDAAAHFGVNPSLPRAELVRLVDAAAAARGARRSFKFADSMIAAAASGRGGVPARDAARELALWREELHGTRGGPFAR